MHQHDKDNDVEALELIRYDFAHVMARAVQWDIWPDVKVTIGPVIERLVLRFRPQGAFHTR